MPSPRVVNPHLPSPLVAALGRPFAATALLAVLLAGPARAEEPPQDRIAYRVKIGFLVNFLRFAEWPEDSLPPGAAFRLAIAGDDATFAWVARALAGKTVSGRAIQVERADRESRGDPPHLLYITESAHDGAHLLGQQFTSAPVLTIGERDGFARRGGILNFVLVDEAVRFEVNLHAAERAGIRISSRVSKMAILVRPGS